MWYNSELELHLKNRHSFCATSVKSLVKATRCCLAMDSIEKEKKAVQKESKPSNTWLVNIPLLR